MQKESGWRLRLKEVSLPASLYWKLRRIAEVHNRTIDEYVTELMRKYWRIPVKKETYEELDQYARAKGLTVAAYLDKLVRTNDLTELEISE